MGINTIKYLILWRKKKGNQKAYEKSFGDYIDTRRDQSAKRKEIRAEKRIIKSEQDKTKLNYIAKLLAPTEIVAMMDDTSVEDKNKKKQRFRRKGAKVNLKNNLTKIDEHPTEEDNQSRYIKLDDLSDNANGIPIAA